MKRALTAADKQQESPKHIKFYSVRKPRFLKRTRHTNRILKVTKQRNHERKHVRQKFVRNSLYSRFSKDKVTLRSCYFCNHYGHFDFECYYKKNKHKCVFEWVPITHK